VTAYALARCEQREPKRLYQRRGEMVDALLGIYRARWSEVKPRELTADAGDPA
jgi:hypothetical protein